MRVLQTDAITWAGSMAPQWPPELARVPVTGTDTRLKSASQSWLIMSSGGRRRLSPTLHVLLSRIPLLPGSCSFHLINSLTMNI